MRENPVRDGLVKSWEDCPFRGEIFDLGLSQNDGPSAVIDRRYSTAETMKDLAIA